MTTTALRELAFAAIAARLGAAVAGVPVERNRGLPVDYAAGEAPRLVLHDGAQAPADEVASGFTHYAVEGLLEGHAVAEAGDGLGAALSELYRRCAAALFGQAVALPGGAEIWPLEGRLDVDFAGALEASAPAAAFFLQLSFDLAAPTGAPSSTY